MIDENTITIYKILNRREDDSYEIMRFTKTLKRLGITSIILKNGKKISIKQFNYIFMYLLNQEYPVKTVLQMIANNSYDMKLPNVWKIS